jgi:ParB-like chromosome segregation protein Spo0J
MTTLQIHPAADWLPQLPESEYAELRDDIQKHGLLEAILVKNGFIIDGRHRYRACLDLGTEPQTEEFPHDDILGVILSRNILRRHLTADQRAMLFAKLLGGKLSDEALARKKSGVANLSTESVRRSGGRTVEKVAAAAKVGRDKAATAIDVVKHAPELAPAVASGKMKLADAAKSALKKRAPARKKPKKPRVIPFSEKVLKSFQRFMDKYPAPQHREVKAILHKFLSA